MGCQCMEGPTLPLVPERLLVIGGDVAGMSAASQARRLRPDPALPGITSPFVSGVQTLADAEHLLQQATAGNVHRVVVVGGGYIGLEMAEAFVQRGCAVTVVTKSPEVMPTLDPDMGAMVSRAMRRHNIEVRCGEGVVGFEGGAVTTDAGSTPPADLV